MSKSWVQHPITLELIPRSEYVRPKEAQHSIFGDIESFVSPIDGTVITGRKGYDEHCRKHNVVNAANFTPEYYAQKAKERAAVHEGKSSKEEAFRRKQVINEIINHHEAQRG